MSFVITGNPGVGKHTIAEKIVFDLDYNIVDLNQVAIKNKIIEESEESLDVDVNELKKITDKMLSKKTLVLGHLAPYVLTEKQVNVAIVLRRDPYKLEEVYKKRKYSDKKILDNQSAEILGIIAYDSIMRFGKEKTIQIDTTNRSVNETVKIIKDILSGKYHEDQIDWLEIIKEKGDIKRFFPTD